MTTARPSALRHDGPPRPAAGIEAGAGGSGRRPIRPIRRALARRAAAILALAAAFGVSLAVLGWQGPVVHDHIVADE